MDSVCKVYRRRTRRQVNNVALRSENEHLIREQVFRNRPQKLDIVLRIRLPIEKLLTQPLKLVFEVLIGRPALFVLPVRCYPELAGPMHLPGADLYLQRLAPGADHLRVKRLIHVRLGLRNVIVEPLPDGHPQVVDHAKGVVAIRNRINYYPDGYKVIDLIEVYFLLEHLLVDAVEMLRAALDLCLDCLLLESILYDADCLVQFALPLAPCL